MIGIRKDFNAKIAVVAVSILLLFNRTAYPSLSRDSLRVEMNRKDVYEDIEIAQNISLLARYKTAIDKWGKKMLTKFWTPKERRYNFFNILYWR